jgi:hypothetical protein
MKLKSHFLLMAFISFAVIYGTLMFEFGFEEHRAMDVSAELDDPFSINCVHCGGSLVIVVSSTPQP